MQKLIGFLKPMTFTIVKPHQKFKRASRNMLNAITQNGEKQTYALLALGPSISFVC